MRNINFYTFLNEGLGSGFKDFNQFVNKFFAKKYNKISLPDGAMWGKNQSTFEYHQLEADAKIYALPSIVDYDSHGKTHGFDRVELSSGKIPRMKHQFLIQETDIRGNMDLMERMGFADASIKDEITKLLYSSTDSLIGGNFNMLEYMRNQAVSTGKFVVNTENNPEGIKALELDFNIPDSHRFKARNFVWDNKVSADPIQDLMDMKKYAKKNGLEYGHFEMSESLWDKFCVHPKVIEKVVLIKTPAIDKENISGMTILEEDIKMILRGLRLPPIKIVDSVVHIDSFDKTTGGKKTVVIDTFDEDVVALIPDGNIGEVKTVKPIPMSADQNPRAFFADKRMMISQVANSSTSSQYIESEFTALFVPTKARNFLLLDTSEFYTVS